VYVLHFGVTKLRLLNSIKTDRYIIATRRTPNILHNTVFASEHLSLSFTRSSGIRIQSLTEG